jgi:hypothetical protein
VIPYFRGEVCHFVENTIHSPKYLNGASPQGFRSAGVSPAVLAVSTLRKKAGETPALRKSPATPTA